MDSATEYEIKRLEYVLNEMIMDEWDAQGHTMTGAAYKEIEYVTKQTADTLYLSGMMNFYVNILAAGTPAGRIPFSGTASKGMGGGTSKYIQALKNYAEVRMGIDESKSLGVAFAIAKTQKKQGMPTKGSYAYTSTGKRTDVIEGAFKKGENKLTETVQEITYNILSVKMDVLLNKWQLEIDKAKN